MFKTLIITSDVGVYRAFSVLYERTLDCYHQESPVLAADMIRETNPHVILIDVDSIHVDPRLFIPQMILAGGQAPVVVILRAKVLELAVEFVRCGAADCLLLPPEEPMETLHRLARLAAGSVVRRRKVAGRKHEAFCAMLGDSRAMTRLQDTVTRVAGSGAPVCIEGETGAGKELVARAIHTLSPRRLRSFVPVNCAALPEQLVESELFGVARGAYTGALERMGRFEEAHGGTLFLDEIGDLAPDAQSKLLRVSEDQQLRRLGSSRQREVDVRLLVATNRPLLGLSAGGEFRKDLLYRLNTLRVHVPSLRERREDIRAIASMHLSRLTEGKRLFSEAALRLLESYDWPGNVRELLNVVERAQVFDDSPVIPVGSIILDE